MIGNRTLAPGTQVVHADGWTGTVNRPSRVKIGWYIIVPDSTAPGRFPRECDPRDLSLYDTLATFGDEL